MKKNVRTIIFIFAIIISFFGPSKIFAQGFLENVPEQDCRTAIPVCKTSYLQMKSYKGDGLIHSEDAYTCLGQGEKNSVWYMLNVSKDGDIVFTITPNASMNDYDFALYNITNSPCSAIKNGLLNPISCNYCGKTGPTGLNFTSNFSSQGGDSFLYTKWNEKVTAKRGETYVLLVSNFSIIQYGYKLDFSSSTAGLYDNQAPHMSSFILGAQSSTGSGQVKFDEAIQCSSISISDFSLHSLTQEFQITSITSPECPSGSYYERIYNITFTPACTSDRDLKLELVGKVRDVCGNLSEQHAVDAEYNKVDLPISSEIICDLQNHKLCVNTTLVSYLVGTTFQWNLDGIPISGATGLCFETTKSGEYSFSSTYSGETKYSKAVIVK